MSKTARKNKRRRSRTRELTFVLVTILLLTGIIYNETQNEDAGKEILLTFNSETSTNNPSNITRNNSGDAEGLLQQLRLVTNDALGTYGVSVVELDTGQSYGVNQDEWFQAASTEKVPILAKLYQEVEAGRIHEDDSITYTPDDYEEGSGSIQYEDFGTQWTVDQLTQKMMKESDNVAKKMLIRLVGLGEIEKFMNDQGSVFNVEDDLTTPASMANLLRRIEENQIVGPSLTARILDLMTNTEYENGIPRYLGDVRVAHKTGAWQNDFSDVGIVFLPGKPFAICIYSEDAGDPYYANQTIGEIAYRVFLYETDRQTAGTATA